MKFFKNLWLPILCIISANAYSQPIPANVNCPPNIGFENGSFNNWQCNSGSILRDGSLNLSASAPVNNRHTIIQNNSSGELDFFGKFPINCPNGSGYSIKLGNSVAGGEAESVSYTFTIPANQNDYSILYNYAVVFQNPPHRSYEQPRFTSKVYNVTDGKYIDCGSFEFVASSNLPGFKLSTIGNNVFYKPWSPVTVDFTGLAGKTVRLEFSTNDCAFTQHFGYAYLDVNEDCSSSPISGSTYCGGAQSVILAAPFGFAGYSWYTSDFSQLLGNQNILTIKPAPPANTEYAVIVTPYEGIGCLDTLFTTIQVSPDPFKLNVLDEITGCSSGVDITAPAITAGSTPGLTYTYYTDLTQTDYVPVPTKITTGGVYYIKGVNKAGCNDIKPIRVNIKEPPNLTITNPAGVCMPQKIDITDPTITEGSDKDLELTYWKNFATTIVLPNPNSIDISGTYYIMGAINGGCGAVKPVEVKIGGIPNVVINNPTACGKVNLTTGSVITGNNQDINYTYWMDAATTVSLSNLNNITVSGTYYLMASSASGCSITRPILVTVNPFPDFTVTDPPQAVYPILTIDLTSGVNQNLGLNFTYWLDSLTKKPVANPRAVNKRGRYFIRGTNEFGCILIKPINAVIIPPPDPIVYVPTAFTPNNDGLNDIFRIKIIGETSINRLRVYNRWGQIVYDNPNLDRQWNGKLKGIDLPVGVYIWILNGIDTYNKKPFAQKGLVTLVR
ncbi:MAG: gliding motility-associated C-terminal domain-containing protein [Chitinophagaceae bacterium]